MSCCCLLLRISYSLLLLGGCKPMVDLLCCFCWLLPPAISHKSLIAFSHHFALSSIYRLVGIKETVSCLAAHGLLLPLLRLQLHHHWVATTIDLLCG